MSKRLQELEKKLEATNARIWDLARGITTGELESATGEFVKLANERAKLEQILQVDEYMGVI